MTGDRLGWGVIGIGNIVKTTIAPAMVTEPNCDLVAGVSRDQGRAEEFGAEFGAPFAYSDYDEMLANPDVQAVFIATPNSQHADQVISAANAGKHVLCDKPLATSVADAERAVDACVEAGVHLGVNFHNRSMPWVREARRVVADGVIGDVTAVHLEVGSGFRHYTNWRADPSVAGMGSVYNVGSHVFDFLGWILGAEPVEVMAMFDNAASSSTVEMLAMTLLRFDNGTMAYVNSNERLRDPQNDITFYGTKGRMVGKTITRARVDGVLEVRSGESEAVTAFPAPNAHQLCVAAFASSVLSDSPPVPSGEDGLRSMVVCDAIARSAAERRLVDVPGRRPASTGEKLA